MHPTHEKGLKMMLKAETLSAQIVERIDRAEERLVNYFGLHRELSVEELVAIISDIPDCKCDAEPKKEACAPVQEAKEVNSYAGKTRPELLSIIAARQSLRKTQIKGTEKPEELIQILMDDDSKRN